MTFGTQTILAERLSRTAGANTITTGSDITKQYLNEGARQFGVRVGGIASTCFLTVNPLIDIDPSFAARYTITGGNSSITATDVPLVSSTLTRATPTTVAAHVASNLNAALVTAGASACITMGWSASTWTFSLSAPSASTIVVGSPIDIRYGDGSPLVFGGVITKSSSTLTSSVPQDCTVETSLPLGFYNMENCFYGSQQLLQAPFNIFMRPMAFGAPQYYGTQNKVIRLWPSPSKQEYFKIDYNSLPVDLGVDGSSDSVSCALPEETHMAPVYYAASMLLEESHEFDKSKYYFSKFAMLAQDYSLKEANSNPTMFPQRGPGGFGTFTPPRVVI